MSGRFQELGWHDTPMGELSLRRRFDLSVRHDVYEIKLDDEYVMTSLFNVAERELATLGLARTPGTDLDVVVGGLGLGYTAREALLCNRIRSLTIIEYSEAVIDWHRRNLLPDTAGLAADDRVTVVQADFFASAASTEGFEPATPGRTFDAILLDIDHSPRHVLHVPHAHFYTPDGIHAAAAHLTTGGTFAMWSDDTPDDTFCSALESVFTDVDARQIWFDNPLTHGQSSATIYLATRP
ncbi:MAG: spermidine synthase [Mycobacterium sp.]|nr:spermidine synthase [Mycobacterium sp.]